MHGHTKNPQKYVNHIYGNRYTLMWLADTTVKAASYIESSPFETTKILIPVSEHCVKPPS
jgi:hypothetical protein